ncbi:MAG: PAS domain S-box protein [Deltaproteobacteria bacterium]|nr:PAS domain S-box protein [Deltaproteobacteria bacterium]MBW2019644.1 PAS domain S-box protein [Deltaproteobacteria bacterium]MBW2074168.1 PAS domain S-box protein [Deltaproteobacteria bacterium]RLB81144.1 MAG: hypothetical protein DRH17_10000 [Deltaproteobacteria bacterium]
MKILIVDDHKEDRYMLEVLLQGHGYEVETAADGVEALEKVLHDDFDIIISDILMPRMDGFRLCREVKKNKNLKNITFVFYTATYTDPGNEEFALSLGAERFIIKPTEPDIFMEILKEVIKSYETGTLVAPKAPIEDETVYLKEYNERLIKKLEDKMLDLERVNKGLNESERKYRELIDNAKDAVIVIESTGHFSFVNPTFCEMTGYSIEEAKKLHFSKLIHPEDFALVTKNFERTLVGEELLKNYEFRVLRKDGNVLDAELNATLIKQEEKIVGIQAIVRDITQRKRTEEKLKQSLEKLQKTMEGTIHAMALAAEMRDPYTAGHQRRVTKLACAIAKEVGLSKGEIDGLRPAGVVHDIGKIYVPAEILSKPGRLTENEFNIIKTHPQVGYDILKIIEFPWPIAKIVLQHHERMDGSGYPQGLSGEEILLEARILSVADVVEAMASHRPYRPALGIDKALEEISENKGVLYDAKAADACLKLFTEKEFKFE